jgi:DNA-binding transcriptional LysR family regulator
MELKQLQAFVVVAEHLHFGLAAEHLRLTQPQVSRRIAQLEEDLNVTLFERSSRTVKLTDVGKAFLPEALTVLLGAETARQRAIERARGRHGVLKISVNDAAMIGSVTPILKTYHKRYPEVYLSFHGGSANSRGQLELLGEGAVEMAFAHPPPPRLTLDFEQIVLVDDPLVAVLPANHRHARRTVLDLVELAGERWVMFPRENDPRVYDEMVDLCRKAGFQPRVVHETTHMLTRLGLTAGGFGINLVHAAWRAMPYPGVVYVPIVPTTNLMLSCFWRRDNTSLLVRNMADIARTQAVGGTPRPIPSTARAAP